MSRDVTTVVICCGDPRFLIDHFEFAKMVCKPGQYTIIPVFGGASVLARPEKFKAQVGHILAEIDFIASRPGSAFCKVILINHDDCQCVELTRSESEEALREAVTELRDILPEPLEHVVEFNLYYGCLNPSYGLEFESVPLRQPAAVA